MERTKEDVSKSRARAARAMINDRTLSRDVMSIAFFSLSLLLLGCCFCSPLYIILILNTTLSAGWFDTTEAR